MKKIKILTPVLTCATLVSAIPALATTSCAGNKTENKKEEKRFVNENLFNVENGVLKGFRAGVTQKEIDDYTKSGVLVLPACKSIGASAFKGVSMPFAEEIVIDNTTVVIEDYAFYGCSSVTEVQWQEAKSKESKLEQIGKSAFAFCTNLKGFKFGPHFSEILENAFYGCKNLRTLDFSSFVTSDGYADIYTLTHNVRIGKNAFLGVLPAETYSSLMIELAPLDEYTIRDPFQLRFSLGDLATKICLNTDWTASNRPGWLKGHAPNVDAFNIDTVIPYEDEPEQGKTSWLKNVDGLLDIKEDFKQELQNTIFNGLFVPEEVDGQVVTGISQNFWDYAGKNLVDADMSHIHFPQDTTGIIQGFKIPNDFAYDSQKAVSKCPNIQNIKFNSEVNLIGDRAFFKSTNLEYVNLNQMNSLRSIGDYAFANTSVRCFGEAPTAAPTWHDAGEYSWCDAHTIQYLKINATSLLRIGTAAFNNSQVEGIKFTCDQSAVPPIPLDYPPYDMIGFSVGDYAFGNCRILGFDLSDLHYDASVEKVGDLPTLSILGLETMESFNAPQMVAFIAGAIINLFAPSTSGLAGRHIFDGSLHFLNGNGETSQNQVIPPSIRVVSGSDYLPNDLSIPDLAIQYFKEGENLHEFATPTSTIGFVGMTGGTDFPELGLGLQELIVKKTAAASADQKAFLNEKMYPVYGPNANYKFQCDYDQTDYIQQIYQVSGEPTFQKEFQFRCDLTSAGIEQHMVVDTTYTTIAVGSRVLMYDKEWTYNPQTSTITINGENVNGDIYVDLRLRVGSINITQTYTPDGEYQAFSSVSKAGYIGQPINGAIYISTAEGGKPDANYGLSNFTVQVGQKTLAQGVEYNFNRLADGTYELYISGEYVTGDVTIRGDVDAAEFEFYGSKGTGVQDITSFNKPKYNTEFTFRVDLISDEYIIDTDKLSIYSDSEKIKAADITIVKDSGGKPAYEITIAGKCVQGNISASVYAKKPTTYQWINNPVDPEHIGEVTCDGTVTELKDAQFKIQLQGGATNIDLTKSRVAVKGTNILTNTEAYTYSVDSGYAILTIKGAYVTGYIVLVLYGQTA